MSFIDFFVIQFRLINYRNDYSPITIDILLHFGREQLFRASVNCCIHNLSCQILGMTGAIVFIANQIAHDFETSRRIFIHGHGQDLSRITRFIAVVDASFMAAFTLADFALIALANFDALIAFAFRNNMWRFVNILELNSYSFRNRSKAPVSYNILAGTVLFSFTVDDYNIKRIYLRICFIVQFFRQDHQGILHFKRNSLIVDRERQETKFIFM